MANITKVYLMHTPLEKDYAHTLYFKDQYSQFKYFESRQDEVTTFTDFTYQRKDNIIRVPLHIDILLSRHINYCMYQNGTGYYNKWFYAFVTDMKYVNDGCTEVSIQTDCIQTWMFETEIKPSFIEREHTKNDDIGENLLDEGLETGAFICNKHTKANYSNGSYVIVGCTETPGGVHSIPGYVTGIWSGVEYFAYDPQDNTSDGELGQLRSFISAFAEEGKADAITVMFMAPKRIVQRASNGPDVTYSAGPHRLYINEEHYPEPELYGEVSENINMVFSKVGGKIDGHTPKNNKLWSYPYRYLIASNNNGASVIYKYEQFYQKTDTAMTRISPKFVIEGSVTPGCSIRLIPLDYNGASRNDEEGLNMGKYPTLNWPSDAYTNWLTQNAVNIAGQVAVGAAQVIAGAAATVASYGTASVIGGGMIASGVGTIFGTLSQVHQQSFTPVQAKGNLNAGDVITASGENDFHFYDMSIKGEYAKIIDEFFDMFGYKCNRVKVPEKNHRENYWYTKTIDANVTGGIPQGDLQTIKDCYNRGITFWKSADNFKDYSVSNKIVQEG